VRRITTYLLALGLFLIILIGPRPAQAFIGALGYLGYGHTFGDNSDNFGPTIEVGGSFSLLFLAIDLTYWNVLDDTADSQSQIRIGARLEPPILPVYLRAAAGIPFDGDVRDRLGTDIILGAGVTAFSIPLLKIVVELDYHAWTSGSGIHPLELKAGVNIGF